MPLNLNLLFTYFSAHSSTVKVPSAMILVKKNLTSIQGTGNYQSEHKEDPYNQMCQQFNLLVYIHHDISSSSFLLFFAFVWSSDLEKNYEIYIWPEINVAFVVNPNP